MSDRKFQLLLTVLGGVFAIAATVIGVKMQRPAASAVDEPAAKEAPREEAAEPEAPEEEIPEPLPKLDVVRDEPDSAEDGLGSPTDPRREAPSPQTFSLKDGQSRDIFGGKVTISTQFTAVAGRNITTVIVLLPDGATERFPFRNPGDQRSFDVDGKTLHLSLLAVDWTRRTIRLRLS